MKICFSIPDNVLDKKLQKYLDDKTFTSKQNVKNIIEEIQNAYAMRFTDGDLKKAMSDLNDSKNIIRMKDAV